MKNQKARNGIFLGLCLSAAVLFAGCGSLDNTAEEEKYRLMGIDALAIGDYDTAIKYFQNALDESIGGISALEVDTCLYEAEALYLSGDAQSALDLYTSLIDYKRYAEVYYLRGNIYFAQGKYELGRSDFDSAVGRASKDYDLYAAIFETMSKYGMSEEGETYLRQALEINGKEAEDYMQRGRMYYLLQDIEEAELNLQTALDMGSVEANYYMSMVYLEKEDKAGAEEYFRTYIESGSADAEKLMKLGENNMNNGDYERALQFLEAGLAMEPTSCRQQLMRDTIIAYEYNGDFSSARSLMREYTALYPTDYEAEDEMTFLETR